MKVCKRWGAAALLSFALWTGATAATTSVEMLREMFRLPVTEWKQELKSNSRLLNGEFFTNVDKRVRWGIENNHVDDAFRFAMVGDFACEAVNKPANYRIDLADIFFKAENTVMTGQIVDNIMITSPGTPAALRAQFLRGRLYEVQKDLFNAYLMFKDLGDKRYDPANSWYKAGMISAFIGEEKRALAELTLASAAGNRDADEIIKRIKQENDGTWDNIDPLPNSIKDNTRPNTNGISANPVDPGTDPPQVATANDPRAKAKLNAASGHLDDAADGYAALFDPQDPQVSIEYGAVLYRMGDLLKAKEIYDKALSKNPQDVELLRGRANTLERMYDREGQRANLAAALADYRSASALAPDHQLLSWELNRAQAKN